MSFFFRLLICFPRKANQLRKTKRNENKNLSHLHAHLRDGIPRKLHRLVGPACHADLADHLQDQVLCCQVSGHLALQHKAKRRRHLHEELPGPEDEAGVGVADAGGELAKGAGVAGVL